MITMLDVEGHVSPYAHNPTIGASVRFFPVGQPLRYGWVAMLTDVGPNAMCEVVIVTDDKRPRGVFLMAQVEAWGEIHQLPPKT
ncbi:hypothetical protein D3C71_77620 [compost metagenome]